MPSTLADFRTDIRTHLDLDDSDLPDVLVDEFIRDGAVLVQYHKTQWPWHAAEWSLAVTAGTQEYAITAATNTDSYVLDQIRLVRDADGNRLRLLEHDVSSGADGTGTPSGYRIFGGMLSLDRNPSADMTLKILGYREPTDWVADGATATPDTPTVFEGVIRKWAIGLAYAHQEEGATASYWMDSAQFELDRLTKRFNDLPPEQLVMNSRGIKSYLSDDSVRIVSV